MNILITGGAGFIGSNLVKNLLETTDHEITVIDRSVMNAKRLEELTEGCRGYNLVVQDYHNVAWEVIKQYLPETVVHLAAIPRVAFSVEHPDTTTYENTYMTTSLLKKCKESGCVKRVVFSSSSSVYGGADILPTSETHPLDPQSPYALQKKNCEEYCKLFSSLYELDTVCLRFFNVFGPEQYVDSPYATVIANWCNAIKENLPLILEDDGEQSRDFSYIDNVVESIKCAIEHPNRFDGDIFNVGDDAQTSLNEILDWFRQNEYSFELDRRPARVGDVRHTRADITKISNIGYKPVCDVWEGLNKTVEWWNIDSPVETLKDIV